MDVCAVPDDAMLIEGVLLAAGESRRMGTPKPLLRIGSDTYISKLCTAMLTAAPRLIVVLGARADVIRPAVPENSRISLIINRDFGRGQLSSLKAGLSAISAAASAAMVHLVDHPVVSAETFQRMAAFYRAQRAAILIARYGQRRGHPVIFGRALFPELFDASEEIGARAVVNAEPARVAYFDLMDRGITLDLDTPEDVVHAGLPSPIREPPAEQTASRILAGETGE